MMRTSVAKPGRRAHSGGGPYRWMTRARSRSRADSSRTPRRREARESCRGECRRVKASMDLLWRILAPIIVLTRLNHGVAPNKAVGGELTPDAATRIQSRGYPG